MGVGFQESLKSKKTVASLIESPGGEKGKADGSKKPTAAAKEATPPRPVETVPTVVEEPAPSSPPSILDRLQSRAGPRKPQRGGKAPAPAKQQQPSKQPAEPKVKGKKARVWDLCGTDKDAAVLDYSAEPGAANAAGGNDDGEGNEESGHIYKQNVSIVSLTDYTDLKYLLNLQAQFVGKMRGELPGLDEGDEASEEEDEDEEEEEAGVQNGTNGARKPAGGGWFSAFKSLVSNKQLTQADLEPVLEKMKEVLICKNVAAEPAIKICESVGAKLEGKVIGTFSRVTSIVREAMRDALIQLLTPKRRVDILRDIEEAKSNQRPYVIVFCGVNGVGKSTNLAKVGVGVG